MHDLLDWCIKSLLVIIPTVVCEIVLISKSCIILILDPPLLASLKEPTSSTNPNEPWAVLYPRKVWPTISSPPATEHEFQADVLSEVLRHSLPSRIFCQSELTSSLDTASKWVLKSECKNGFYISSQTLNPLRDYMSVPQVTFGPKRWQFPRSEGYISLNG
ncbi:uncharacterized protein LOC126798599 [Argentina anserina]|uniref:uncharacterized protein LOC126798599 n=1 Tax=Argentina anserina TaxID=57926 RepID=UPI0021767E1E|nr:uncharacterized protein LOC126798599 [Potentilla anserina]